MISSIIMTTRLILFFLLFNFSSNAECEITWPREPIAPGQTAKIKVKYNTSRAGAINKSITITSNAVNTPTKVLRIKGNVKAKAADGVPVNKGGGKDELVILKVYQL